jgi:hypothetical protein
MQPPRRTFSLLWILIISVILHAGCNGPDSLKVDGNWSGTWRFVASGLTVTDQVTATLTQDGTQASGFWTAASGASGQLNFNAMGATSGTLTINQATLTPQSCNATTTFQGTVTDTHLDITMVDIPPAGICQWGTNSRFVLDKQ